MPQRRPEKDLALIVQIVRQRPDGARRNDIAQALKQIPQRTLQYWLKSLVDDGRLTQEGKGPAARYRTPAVIEEQTETPAQQARAEEEKAEEAVLPLSPESEKIHERLKTAVRRKKSRGV